MWHEGLICSEWWRGCCRIWIAQTPKKKIIKMPIRDGLNYNVFVCYFTIRLPNKIKGDRFYYRIQDKQASIHCYKITTISN